MQLNCIGFDAWLRKPRVIVGHNRVDDDLAVMPAAQFLDRRGGAFNRLCQRRSKSRALQGGGSKFGQLATMSANKLVTRSDTP